MVASRSIISAMVLAPSTSIWIFGLDCNDALFRGYEQAGHVGEVEFAVGIVGCESVDVLEEWCSGEGVDAGVDLWRLCLRWGERLLLDDGCDFGRVSIWANDAAIAKRVCRRSGKDGHRG